MKNIKYTTEYFIDRAIVVHGTIYDYSLVNYEKTHNKVKIICKIHGVFNQTPLNHLQGSGCPKCANCDTLCDFIEKANAKHLSRYDYSVVKYINSSTQVDIRCKIHGMFKSRPSDHLYKTGCPTCSVPIITTKEFKEKSIIVHGDIYDYSTVEYVTTHHKVNIICYTHGTFQQTPASHLSGQGCPKCGHRYTISTSDFIQRAIEVHGNKYDYSNVDYTGVHNRVDVWCPTHGIFQPTPINHIRGKSGCPKCNPGYSIACISWLESIMVRDGIYIQHGNNIGEYKIPGTLLSADGYHKDTNTNIETIYEFYGDYWHGNPDVHSPTIYNKSTYSTMGELYQNTMDREKVIKEMGYNLISIWENDYIPHK